MSITGDPRNPAAEFGAMHFSETGFSGAFVVDLHRLEDDRGFFARTFCTREFRQRGLADKFVQCNTSFNRLKGTVRGLHFLAPPSDEAKLVRCTSGAVFDVIVDLRPDSPTHLQHFAVELSAENRRALFVPPQFAHGFQTLSDRTEVFYQMGDYYAPELSLGIRYDDPKLAIQWPLPVSAISDKDRSLPLL